MVSQDFDRQFGTLEFRSPFLKISNDRKQFLVVDFVIILSNRMLLRKEGNRSQDTIIAVL